MVVFAGNGKGIAVDGLELVGLTMSAANTAYLADSFYERVVIMNPTDPKRTSTLGTPGIDGDLTLLDNELAYCVGDQLHFFDLATDSVSRILTPRPGNRIAGVHAWGRQVCMSFPELGVLDVREGADLDDVVECYALDGATHGLTVIGDGVVTFCTAETGMACMVNPKDPKARFEVSTYGKPTAVAWDSSTLWYLDSATLQLRSLELPAQPARGIDLKPVT